MWKKTRGLGEDKSHWAKRLRRRDSVGETNNESLTHHDIWSRVSDVPAFNEHITARMLLFPAGLDTSRLSHYQTARIECLQTSVPCYQYRIGSRRRCTSAFGVRFGCGISASTRWNDGRYVLLSRYGGERTFEEGKIRNDTGSSIL